MPGAARWDPGHSVGSSLALREDVPQGRGRVHRRREPGDRGGEHDRLAKLVFGQPRLQRGAEVLGQLGGAAERGEGDDRAELSVAIGQRRLRVEVAVDERHDVTPELAEPLDGTQRLLVVHLQESRAAAFVPLVHRRNGTPSARSDPTFGRGRTIATDAACWARCGSAWRGREEGTMETEITLIGGSTETFPSSVEIKFTQFGVEVLSRDDEENGPHAVPLGADRAYHAARSSVSAVYTY